MRKRRARGVWLVQGIKADVTAALSREQPALRRVWASLRAQASEPGQPGSWRLVRAIGLYFAFLLVLAVTFRLLEPSLLPDWRPASTEDGLVATWQVLAALVAAALPFLFVLLPLVRNEALAVTRTAQVLMADTLLFPILAFGLAGTVWTGVATIWLSSDTSLWIAFFFVLTPTALGVGFAYLTAGRIISDPQHVRRQAMRLLLEIIDDTLIEQQSIAYANGELVELLESNGFRRSELFAEPDDAIAIPALQDGVLRDVNKDGLQDWLQSLVTQAVPSATYQTADTTPDEVAIPSDDERGWWRPLIGERLSVGAPVVLLSHAVHEEIDAKELATTLARSLEVE